jgi:hypothetical protein
MADPDFSVTARAGTLCTGSGVRLPHAWTDEGVEYDGPFTGAHLLHLAVAGCVLNDTYREGRATGLEPSGVAVTATGTFDDGWVSTGIRYAVELAGLDDESRARLLARVDEVAEIPRAVRAGAPVARVDALEQARRD